MIAVLITMSAILGLSGYWRCHDANHPAFFTPLMATASLVKGAERYAEFRPPADARSGDGGE